MEIMSSITLLGCHILSVANALATVEAKYYLFLETKR